MPTYCYRRGREKISRVFHVNDIPATVTYHGLIYKRSQPDEWLGISVPMDNKSGTWPLECVASGVAPSQAGELRKYFKDHGCPTEVSEDGNPIYRNASHRRKALKLRGFKDRGGYFG